MVGIVEGFMETDPRGHRTERRRNNFRVRRARGASALLTQLEEGRIEPEIWERDVCQLRKI